MLNEIMLEAPSWLPYTITDKLAQKAGVTPNLLPKLVAKELMDNALDESEGADCGEIGKNGFYVRDYGRGMDKGMIEKLFSVKRTTASTKQWLLPTRGAQGNGLRVVTGFLIATQSKMIVHSKGKQYNLKYDQKGNTEADVIGSSKINTGSMIELFINKEVDGKRYFVDLEWADMARSLNFGEDYKGSTSAYWYDVETMRFNLLSTTDQTLRQFISIFDGCKGARAGEIASYFDTNSPKEIANNNDNVIRLLDLMQEHSRPVNPNRLGEVGKGAFSDFEYMKKTGETNKGQITIPSVMEVWARKADNQSFSVSINKTPINGVITSNEISKELYISGCGLYLSTTKINNLCFEIIVNIQTPHYVQENEGKKPDLYLYEDSLRNMLNTLIRRIKRNESKLKQKENPPSQKEIILRYLEKAVEDVSSNGTLRFSERQLYYQIRPMVINHTGRQLNYSHFSGVIAEYESNKGDISGIYRDTRGVLYVPHGHDEPLGTHMVEEYRRPKWEFNKLIYCEKEGLFEALKDVKFPERYDCALLTSKGFATRAARDLIDKLAETGEEISFYCVHDADAPGTMIYQTLIEETKTRGARNIHVENLGLEPWEGQDIGLEPEDTNYTGNQAVADYVPAKWKRWLQTKRIELNAMKPAQFIDWLEKKMDGHRKVIPPESVLIERLDNEVKSKVEQHVIDSILKKYDIENLTEEEYKKVESEIKEQNNEIYEEVIDDLKDLPSHNWKQTISEIANDILKDV